MGRFDVLGISFVLFMVVAVVFSMICMVVPHGERCVVSGVIVDVDYSQGGYMTPSATYVTFDSGVVLCFYGTDEYFRQGVFASVVYLDGGSFMYFVSIDYGGD